MTFTSSEIQDINRFHVQVEKNVKDSENLQRWALEKSKIIGDYLKKVNSQLPHGEIDKYRQTHHPQIGKTRSYHYQWISEYWPEIQKVISTGEKISFRDAIRLCTKLRNQAKSHGNSTGNSTRKVERRGRKAKSKGQKVIAAYVKAVHALLELTEEDCEGITKNEVFQFKEALQQMQDSLACAEMRVAMECAPNLNVWIAYPRSRSVNADSLHHLQPPLTDMN